MTPASPALLEAAKVLYEAGAEYQMHGKPAPWEMLGSHTRTRLIEQARALLRWELTREPSEGAMAEGADAPYDFVLMEDVLEIHRAMSRHRLTELGIEG